MVELLIPLLDLARESRGETKMLIPTEVNCVACGKPFPTCIQFIHKCVKCNKDIEVCPVCRESKRISYERCPLCGGKIGKSDMEKGNENGQSMLF
jgi:hypothetical protein